ncbi:GNAT family N-acetyltransferase [Cohnella sp. REN36]|uniref:GNAT family N-acetyltransferase n=1 Tax=Cohnella sp. REN36 TaxID=2887347 RepID=UPI001D14A181|nr:GNAT family N-acetyltransferase [Cohnella sp. REN36]MCC3374674.1 GNAT family N-acetyltransferase [Cohnella sp. REN36]
MREEVRLARPTTDLREEYVSFYREWLASGEDMVPWVIERDPTDFAAMVRFLLDNEKGEHLPEGWVPDSTFWLVGSSGRVLGAVNIRHRLTDKLLQSGGHIGYGIRPSERRKGYATRLLSLTLEMTRSWGWDRVLVVCDADNIASERTIVNNGGVPDASYIEENGNVVKRFWIDLRPDGRPQLPR